jgi:hypothetical protein
MLAQQEEVPVLQWGSVCDIDVMVVGLFGEVVFVKRREGKCQNGGT